MRDLPPHLKLKFNPFEPSGAGPPLGTAMSIPGSLKSRVHRMLEYDRVATALNRWAGTGGSHVGRAS